MKNRIKKFKWLIIASILALILVGAAAAIRINEQRNSDSFSVDSVLPPDASSADTNKEFTAADLALKDGKNDNDCYVAVDGKVYEIKQGVLWNNGSHDPSGGEAMCGRDLSEAIGKSPHGKSKLSSLPQVGVFTE